MPKQASPSIGHDQPNRAAGLQELFPGAYKPTPTHSFMRLLARKGLLLRCFTQNIDSLERQAGTDPGLIVAAHGNFDTAACINCGAKVAIEDVERSVMAGKVCHCQRCKGLVGAQALVSCGVPLGLGAAR